ncbi:MAG TPA: 30S ribosome-binding factor RbfA [Myxococcota bacterium]|nr:30S ribosome-binding factor RbfA [Myxococcota bacterium]
MTRRTERVASELRALLARLLREEVTDPRIGLVTLTRVDVAPDLSHALVFWSALGARGEGATAECQEGLESAAAFLRRRAARELALKRMPELRFRYDPSLQRGQETLDLLRELEATRAADGEATRDAVGETTRDANGETGADD